VAAAAAGLADVHRETLARAHPLAAIDDNIVKHAEQALSQVCAQRQRMVGEVRKLNERLKDAERAFAKARDAQQERRQELDQRLTEEAQARDELFSARDALESAYRTFCIGLRELHPQDADEVAAALAVWAEASEGTSPVERAVRAAAQEALTR